MFLRHYEVEDISPLLSHTFNFLHIYVHYLCTCLRIQLQVLHLGLQLDLCAIYLYIPR